MTRKIGILIIVSLIVSSLGYVILGGLSKPALSQAQIPAYTIAGKAFRGNATSDTLMQLFTATQELHKSGKLPGILAAVYYNSPDEANGRVNVWVGVLVRDSTAALPKGYLFRSFPSTFVVRAEIKAHYMVAPTPDKVKSQLQDFATAERWKPGSYVLEQYLNEKEIIMEIPVTKL